MSTRCSDLIRDYFLFYERSLCRWSLLRLKSQPRVRNISLYETFILFNFTSLNKITIMFLKWHYLILIFGFFAIFIYVPSILWWPILKTCNLARLTHLLKRSLGSFLPSIDLSIKSLSSVFKILKKKKSLYMFTALQNMCCAAVNMALPE